MTIKKKFEEKPRASDSEINDFIAKGGDVKSDQAKETKVVNVLIRFDKDLLNQVDKLVKERPWMSRTAWILEAVLEKVKNNERF